MIAVGLGLVWVAYTLVLYGYTRIHQMSVGFMDLVIPKRLDMCNWEEDLINGAAAKAQGCTQGSSGTGVDPSSYEGGKGTAGGVVSIATSQLGTKATGGYCQKYGQWYGMNCVEWCAIFVSWCMNQNGSLAAMGGKASYVPTLTATFQAMGIWHNGSSGAQPGDILIFNIGGQPHAHTGICTVAADSAGNVTSIAGDTGNSDVAVEHWSAGSVTGYGRPNYSGNDTTNVVAA